MQAARPGWKLTPFPSNPVLPPAMYARPELVGLAFVSEASLIQKCLQPIVIKRYLPENTARHVKVDVHQLTPVKVICNHMNGFASPLIPSAPLRRQRRPRLASTILLLP